MAENYAKRIDAFADVATTGIAILGAIAAAVITVVTGGAAAPLIAAAVIAGLASMSANYALKGGRYGWEQAAVDLGMTAVQAITAGVGAQLGAAAQVASKGAAAASAASRSLTTLARLFTGNPVVDQIIVGAITGSIGGVANVAFDERTWEHSGGDAVGALFSGLLKGALSGAATAALTNSIEALGRNGAAISERARAIAAEGGVLRGAVGLAGRGVGGLGRGINAALNASTGGGMLASAGSMAGRGLTRGVISGLGGMAGRSTELLYDRTSGRFRGDAGDALLDIGRAGAHAFVQGIGEGAGEAAGQGVHNRRLMAAAEGINRARADMGLPPLEGHPLHEGSPLRAAAEDLMFLNLHGRTGGDALSRAVNLDHIATHGGLAATVATVHPNAIVEDGMRAELMRHVDPDLHGDFADVPIRVLPEAEYRALTRSESGPVVTLIQDGRPVVVVREGTPIARLADEGPHLVQSRDAHTRERVARLDEATMARWDSLDLDTQLDLYRNKIELEIDAHQRVHASLEAELARARSSGADEAESTRIAAELERNAGTLRNLRARHDEVGNIGPQQRAAIEAGEAARPQYLDQPPRLFSKEGPADGRRTPEEQLSDDILETMLTEIAEKRRMSARGGLVEDELQDLPEAVVAFLRRGERMPGRGEVPPEVKAWARRVARERFGRQLQDALLDPGLHNRMTQAAVERLSDAQLEHVRIHGELPEGVEFHHLLPVADFPEFAHLAEAGTALPTDVHREAGHAMDPTRPVEAGTLLDPEAETRPIGQHLDPEARKYYRPTAREVAEGTRTTRDVDRDLVTDYQQRVRRAESALRTAEAAAQRRPTPENIARADAARAAVARAQEHLAEVQARVALHAEMRAELMRHVSPEMHADFADVPIRILPEAEYRAFTRSDAGPVVTIFQDGRPIILVREGTHPSRLADEGTHLVQSREAHTAGRVARLDEAELARWDHLDLDTQLDLYRNKIELEIDAHERIARSLRGEAPQDAAEQARVAAELDRAHGTLRNLRSRLGEVDALGPHERTAIRSGEQPRPQYLDQPPRLFSKDLPGAAGAPRRTVLEPFVGPSLESPQELQSRHPGAEVIAAEASRPPAPAEIAAFQERGGRFIAERFGESLPDNSVDQMHVRFPLPHAKAQEMAIDIRAELAAHPGMTLLEILAARQAGIESVTNLGPHALRTLRPGGELEVVYWEHAVGREVDGLSELIWTDPATGERYRLEAVAAPTSRPRAEAAPHSGFGIPDDVTHVNVVTVRKVRIAPEPDTGAPGAGRRPAVTEEERVRGRELRAERKRSEREERRLRREERVRWVEAEQRRAQQQEEAVQRRQVAIDEEAGGRRRAVEEGRVSPEQDFRQRLATVAAELDIDVERLATVIRQFTEQLGGSGRRFDAQDVIDSLRNRARDGRPPRFGELEGLVSEIILEQNAIAVQQMREHIAQSQPDAVLGVERGGAFLAEVLSTGVEGFPRPCRSLSTWSSAKAALTSCSERRGWPPRSGGASLPKVSRASPSSTSTWGACSQGSCRR